MAGIGQWQPAKGVHAIQMAAVTINFAEGITAMLLDAAERAAAPLAREIGLEQRTQLQEVAIAMGPNGPQQQAQTTSFDFIRLERPDFFSDKISIGRNALRYEDWSYTRWAVMLEKISKLMSAALPSYLKATAISQVSVEYVDVFLAPSNSADSIKLVIRDDSDFIASGVISDTGLWHTHSGFFEPRENGVRRLHQVNIDVADLTTPEGLQRAAQIRTYAADQPVSTDAAVSNTLAAEWTAIVEHLDSLHNCTKADFKAILTSEAASAVSLG